MPRIHVTARREGFRRAGRAWPAGGTIVDTDNFTDEELDQLAAEPQLVVAPAPDAEPPADGKAAPKQTSKSGGSKPAVTKTD